MEVYGIYKILNLITNKFYLGSSVYITHRFNQHKHLLRKGKHHSPYLQKSWNKYGEQNFTFELIYQVFNKTHLLLEEQRFLDIYKPDYNSNRVSPTRLGSKASPELRRKLSLAHKGKSSPKKGIKTGLPAWNRGISQIVTEETRKKMIGRRNSIKTEFKPGEIGNPTRITPVLCVETNIEYKSIADAARHLGNIQYQSNISSVCYGRQKTAYGFTWRFI